MPTESKNAPHETGTVHIWDANFDIFAAFCGLLNPANSVPLDVLGALEPSKLCPICVIAVGAITPTIRAHTTNESVDASREKTGAGVSNTTGTLPPAKHTDELRRWLVRLEQKSSQAGGNTDDEAVIAETIVVAAGLIAAGYTARATEMLRSVEKRLHLMRHSPVPANARAAPKPYA